MAFDPEKANELKMIVTNPVFRDVMAELERDAFNAFMALPMTERMARKGETLIARIDALRDVRGRLNLLASTQDRVPLAVV